MNDATVEFLIIIAMFTMVDPLITAMIVCIGVVITWLIVRKP